MASDNQTPEERLQALGLVLPKAKRPVANYLMCKTTAAGLLFVSGHAPVDVDGHVITGKVGRDLDIDAARAAARLTGLSMLATIRRELGTLDRVRSVVKIFAMINAAPGFVGMTSVMDACSDLFVEVFGDAGRHARAAVGMAELPSNIAVEIEGVFEVDPG